MPSIIAMVRFRLIHKRYYPFIFSLWLGCLSETISYVLVFNKQPTHVHNNIYILLEAILLTWYFKEEGLFRKKGLFPLLLALLTGSWLAENFLFSSVTHFSAWSSIFLSFLVVFFSISTINKSLFSNRRHLLGDATFILCSCFIVFYTYKALVYAFVLYGATGSDQFLLNLFIIMVYINLITNLLFALAVLWMPRKVKYLQLSLLPSA